MLNTFLFFQHPTAQDVHCELKTREAEHVILPTFPDVIVFVVKSKMRGTICMCNRLVYRVVYRVGSRLASQAKLASQSEVCFA